MKKKTNDNILHLDKSNEVTAFVGDNIKVDDIADHVLSGENFISYYGAYTDTDFIYSVQNEGIKEYIIFNFFLKQNLRPLKNSAVFYCITKRALL